MNRWSKAGVTDRGFARPQPEQILPPRLERVCRDSTVVKVHPAGTGALKKPGRKPSATELDRPRKVLHPIHALISARLLSSQLPA